MFYCRYLFLPGPFLLNATEHKRKYNTLIGPFPVFANANKRAVLQRQTKSFRTCVYLFFANLQRKVEYMA